MICERCGYEKANDLAICPACGTASTRAKEMVQPPTRYGPHPYNKDASLYYQGQVAQPEAQMALQQQQPGYTSPYMASTYHPRPYNAANPAQFTITNKDNSPLVIEIILSLFGIFGVGWLIARETTIGIILLICSFLVYWPIMLIGTVLTFGIGLLCLGPLAIGAIILNALLFNMILNRRATQFVVMPPSQVPPPQ